MRNNHIKHRMNTKAQCCKVSSKLRFLGFFGAIIAVIAIFFVIPVLEKNFYTHLFLECSFTLLILSTLYTIEGQQTILATGFFFLVPFIILDSMSFQSHSMFYMIIAHTFSSFFTLISIVIVLPID